MIINKNSQGSAVLEAALLLVIISLFGFSGWFVMHSKHIADVALDEAASHSEVAEAPSNAPKGTDDESVVTTGVPSTNIAQSSSTESKVDTQQSFTFLDTADWVEHKPADGSYVVKLSRQATYGVCNKNASTFMVGMVMLNGNDDYDCSGIKDAVALKPGPGDMVLTRVVFAKSDKLWDRPKDSLAQTIKLVSGEDAIRYKYTNTVDGRTFDNIEYSVTHDGVNYIAINHWADNFNNDLYGISETYFDTIVQKTLIFN
jgi:hypothetical protein